MTEASKVDKSNPLFWVGFFVMIIVGMAIFIPIFNTGREMGNELIDIVKTIRDRPDYPVFNLTALFGKEDEALVYIIDNTGADSDYFILEIPGGGVYELDYGLKAGESYFVTRYMGYQIKSGTELRVGVVAEWVQDGEKTGMEWELFYTLTEDDMV